MSNKIKELLADIGKMSDDEKKALRQVLGVGGRGPTDKTKATFYAQPSENAGMAFYVGSNGARVNVPMPVVMGIIKYADAITKLAAANADKLKFDGQTGFAAWWKDQTQAKPALWKLGDFESKPLDTVADKAERAKEWEARKAARSSL